MIRALRQPTLPVAEFLHPLPLAALMLLAINDHVLKQAGILPGWLTGKLSDVAGMVFFPLLLTALFDTSLFGLKRLARRLGRNWSLDYSLRRWKIALACALTAIVFSAVQVWPAAAEAQVTFTGWLGIPSRVTPDPTDLLALLFLPLPWIVAIRQMGVRENGELAA